MPQKKLKPKFILSQEEINLKLKDDSSFVLMRRFNYSIEKLEERYPMGCPDHIAAQSLGLEIEELQNQYLQIVKKLRANMGVTL